MASLRRWGLGTDSLVDRMADRIFREGVVVRGGTLINAIVRTSIPCPPCPLTHHNAQLKLVACHGVRLLVLHGAAPICTRHTCYMHVTNGAVGGA